MCKETAKEDSKGKEVRRTDFKMSQTMHAIALAWTLDYPNTCMGTFVFFSVTV